MLPRIWNRWFNRHLKKSSTILKSKLIPLQLEKLEDKVVPATIAYNPVWVSATTGAGFTITDSATTPAIVWDNAPFTTIRGYTPQDLNINLDAGEQISVTTEVDFNVPLTGERQVDKISNPTGTWNFGSFEYAPTPVEGHAKSGWSGSTSNAKYLGDFNSDGVFEWMYGPSTISNITQGNPVPAYGYANTAGMTLSKWNTSGTFKGISSQYYVYNANIASEQTLIPPRTLPNALGGVVPTGQGLGTDGTVAPFGDYLTLRLTVTSTMPLSGGGVISNANASPGDNPSQNPFSWSFTNQGPDGKYRATGLLRSKNLYMGSPGTTGGVTMGVGDASVGYNTATHPELGYLYTKNININQGAGAETVDLNGMTLYSDRTKRLTRNLNGSGNVDYTMIGIYGNLNVDTGGAAGDAINVKGPIESFGSRSFNFTFATDAFSNDFNGGSKIETLRGAFNLNARSAAIGTTNERIYAYIFNLSAGNISLNGSENTAMNFTSNEMLSFIGQPIPLLPPPSINFQGSNNFDIKGNSNNVTDLTNSNINSYTISNFRRVQFSALWKLPVSSTLVITLGSSGSIESSNPLGPTNPNGIDLIMEQGILSMGTIDSYGKIDGVGSVGTAIRPLRTSINTLDSLEVLGDFFMENFANPEIGGQNADLIVGASKFTGPIFQASGGNTFYLSTTNGRATINAQLTANKDLILKTASYSLATAGSLWGTNSILLEPSITDYNVLVGNTTANLTDQFFDVTFSDITNRINTQNLKIGANELVGNFSLFNNQDSGNTTTPLNLIAQNFNFTLLGKDSDVLLNTGILLADNRRMSFQNGRGGLGKISSSIPTDAALKAGFYDIAFGANGTGTRGQLDFRTTGQVGETTRPLLTKAERLDGSSAPLGLHIQNQSNLIIINQINTGTAPLQIFATGSITRTNPAALSDLVGGPIEIVTNGTLLGALDAPLRISGDSLAARSKGDTALYLSNPTLTDGDVIDVATATSMRIFTYGAGLSPSVIPTGIWSTPSDDVVNKRVLGTTLLSGLPGAANPSVYRINQDNQITTNLVPDPNMASVNLVSAKLDLQRFSQQVRYLTGNGELLSDPLIGQSKNLTVKTTQVWDAPLFSGKIDGSLDIIKTDTDPNSGQKLSQTGSFTLTGDNRKLVGDVRVFSGSVIFASSTAAGTNNTIRLGNGSLTPDETSLGLSNNITLINKVQLNSDNTFFINVDGVNQFAPATGIELPLTTSLLVIDVPASPDATSIWSLTVGASIIGPGFVDKTGTGLLILTKTNTFAGRLHVYGGTLEVQASNTLGKGKAIFDPATIFQIFSPSGSSLLFDVDGGIDFLGANTLVAKSNAQIRVRNNSIHLLGGTVPVKDIFKIFVDGGKWLKIEALEATNALDGINTNLVRDEKLNTIGVATGTGVLELKGPSVYNDLKVNLGTVIFDGPEAVGSGSIHIGRVGTLNTFGTVAFDPGAGATMSISNLVYLLGKGSADNPVPLVNDQSVLKVLTGDVTLLGAITLTSTANVPTLPIFVEGLAKLRIPSSINDSGANLAMEKKGTGNLYLSAANVYGGGTQIKAGTIFVLNKDSLYTGPVRISDLAALTVDLGFDGVGTPLPGNFVNQIGMEGAGPAGAGALVVQSGLVNFTPATPFVLYNNTTIAIPDSDSSLTLTANITEGVVASGITKTGPGILVIKPTTFNSTTGANLIASGPMEVQGNNAFGRGDTTIANGAGLIINPTTLSFTADLFNNFIVAGAGCIAPPNTNGISTKGVIELVDGRFSTITGNMTLTESITIDVGTGSILTLDGVLDENAPGVQYNLTKTGLGILRLTGATPNLLDGKIIVLEGSVDLGKTGAAGTGLIQILDGGTLIVSGANTPSLATVIANAIEVEGKGLADQGAIKVTQGYVNLTGDITITDSNGDLSSLLWLGANNLPVINNPGILTIEKPFTLATTTTTLDLVSGGIGAGVVNLGGTNLYAGLTTIQEGALVANAVDALGTNRLVNVEVGGTLGVTSLASSLAQTDINLFGSGLNLFGKDLGALWFNDVAGVVTLGQKIVLNDALGPVLMTAHNSASQMNLTGAISSLVSPFTGTTSIRKGGQGTIVFQSANSYGGGTVVENGTLLLQNPGALGNATANVSVLATGTLALDMALATFNNPLSLAGSGLLNSGALDVRSGQATFTNAVSLTAPLVTIDVEAFGVDLAPAKLTFAGQLSESVLTNLVKTGLGTVVLKMDNSLTGTVQIQAGLLTLESNKAAGTGAIVVSDGATLGINIPSTVIANKITLSGEGLTPIVPPTGTPEAALWIQQNTTVAFNGVVELGLTNSVDNNLASTALFVDKSAKVTFNSAVRESKANGSVASELIKRGPGQAEVLGAVANDINFRGGINVEAGKLTLGVDNTSNNFKNGGALQVNYGATLLLQGNSAINNAVNLGIPGKTGVAPGFGTAGSSVITITKDITVDNDKIRIETADTSKLTHKGSIVRGVGQTTLSMEKDGTGTLVLNNQLASNQVDGGLTASAGILLLNAKAPFIPFAGNLTVQTGAEVVLLAANQIPAVANVTIRTGGILDLNGFSTPVNSVVMSGDLSQIQGLGSNLTANLDYQLDGGSVEANLAGAALATVSLVKNTTSTLNLLGQNTYNGSTDVKAGKLVLINAAGNALPDLAIVNLTGATSVLDISANETIGSVVSVINSTQIVIGTSKTLTLSSSGDAIFPSQLISVGGTLLKTGTGLMTINGDNSGFSGGAININVGNVQFDGAMSLGALATPPKLSTGLASSATINVAGTNTFNNAIDLGSNLTSKAGSVTLGGIITLTGPATNLTVSGIELRVKQAVANTSATLTNLTKSGNGTLVIESAMDLKSGKIQIPSGKLIAGNSNSLGMGLSIVTVATSASLAFDASIGGVNLSVANPISAGGNGFAGQGALQMASSVGQSVTLSGPVVLTLDTLMRVDAGSTIEITGAVSGNFKITKVGLGTLILSGTQGGSSINIQEGVVKYTPSLVGKPINIGVNGTLLMDPTIVSSATNTITTAGRIEVVGLGAVSLAGVITTSGAPSFFATDAGSVLNLDSALGGTATGLKVGGTGIVNANGTNAFTGPWILQGGILGINNTGAFNSNNIQVVSGTILLGANANLGALDSADNGSVLDLAGFNATLSISGNHSFAGSLTGPSNSVLTLAGTGSQTFTGSTNNTLMGGIVANSGNTVLARSGVAVVGSLVVNTGALVTLSADGQFDSAVSLDVNGGTLATGTYNQGLATLCLQGNGTVTGTGTLSLVNDINLLSGTVSAKLIGAAGLAKTTTGTATISGKVTTANMVIVSGGILVPKTTDVLLGTPGVQLNAGTTLSLAADQTLNDLTGTGTVQLNGFKLTILANTPVVFGGTITGSGTLVKSGTSDLTLTGANNPQFTQIVSGNLVLDNDATNSTTLGGLVAVNADASLVLGQANQLADTASIVVNDGIFAMGGYSNGVKDVTLSGVNGFITGSLVSVLTINGSLNLETDPSHIEVTINGPGVFVYRVSTTISTPVPTTGGVRVEGATTVVTLSGATQVISGNLTISAGATVVLGASNQISNTGIIRIEGNSTFNIGAFSDTVKGVELILGSLIGTTGTLTSSTTIVAENGTISGNLAGLDGTVGLNKTNSTGTVTLSTPVLLTGDLKVTAGRLVANSPSAATFGMNKVLVNGGTLSVGANATTSQFASTADLSVSAGILSLANFDQSFKTIVLTGGEISSTGGRLFTQQTNFTLVNGTVSARLAGATTGLVASGTGTLVLTGVNSYGGTTSITGGTVAANSSGVSLPGNVNISGGKLLLLKSQQIADTATVAITGGSMDFGSALVAEKLSTLRVEGGLVGPTAGSSLGSVEAASFDLRSGRVNSSLTGSGKITKTTPGSLTLSGTNTHTGGNDIQAGTLLLAATNGGSLPGATTIGAATVTVQVNNQITGPLTIQGGTLNVQSFNNTVQSLNLVSGTINGNSGNLTSLSDIQASQGTIGAVLAGGVNFAKNTTGTVTFGKPMAYFGTTAINSGTLALSGTGSIPDGSVVTVATGATVNLAGISDKIGGLVGTGNVSLGTSTLTNLTLSLINATSTNSFSGSLSGTGNLLKSGPGTQVLAGTNPFVGSVQVQTGTLTVNAPGKDGINNANAVILSSTGTLRILTNETTGPLTGSGLVEIASATTLTSTYLVATTVGTTLTGAGNLVKAGAGSVALNTSSAGFTGAITVNQGTLSFAGTTGGTLNATGGTLNAIGTVAGITVTGGTFSPGSSPGTVTAGNLNLATGSTYLEEINGSVVGTGYDQTVVTAGVNLAGSKLSTVLGTGFKPTAGQQFTIVDNQSSGLVLGTFTGLAEGSSFTSGSTRFQITYKGGTGNDVVLTVAQVSVAGGMVLGSPGATAPGAVSVVTVYNTNGVATKSFAPFANYGGALRTAVGDLNNDGTPEIVVAAGTGAAPAVKVFDGSTGAQIFSFLAYAQNFNGGVSVATGDVNGDGVMDIVTATLTGSNHIKVFSGKDLTILKSFMPFGTGYTGGVNIAAGDFTGDGKADVIVGAAKNSSHTLVLDVSSVNPAAFTVVQSFFAFTNQNLPGGVFVAAGDINGDGKADILAGTGSGTPQMQVFYGPSRTPGVAVMLNPNFAGGVRVNIADVNGDGLIDLVGGSGPGYAPTISVYAGLTGAFIKNLNSPYPSTFRGGIVF